MVGKCGHFVTPGLARSFTIQLLRLLRIQTCDVRTTEQVVWSECLNSLVCYLLYVLMAGTLRFLASSTSRS